MSQEAMRQMIEAVRAMRDGDFSVRLPGHWPGLEGELAEALNGVAVANQRTAEQIGVFASEVMRVAREVGTEGKLGGQADVPVASGVWRQLTDSVNSMAGNVSTQARHISEVTIAVARGDLSKKITVEANGEILQLKETINSMVDQLGAFASEIMRVAREVGSEGKLESQAQVPGVAGTWKNITDSFNSMIDNLRLTTLRTEALLVQSQQLAAELQSQQRELQQTNAQLALTSRYKSEFLANMSHELRTPLNSILILGQQLSENAAGNLTPKQLEFIRAICGAGTDLLGLITDILDLSKIESGTVTIEPAELLFATLLDSLSRQFRHEAERRGLAFEISIDPSLGGSLVTDQKRLQQVLTNLLANAFKFTAAGSVRLAVFPVSSGWTPDHPVLGKAGRALAFEVSDTGIGIAPEKQRLVFEAFQQADAGTSRKYGGTGLGLAISRDLTSLLGGEIQLRSTPGAGSTFTVLLPLAESDPAEAAPGAVPPAQRFDEATLLRRRAAGEPPAAHQALRGRKVLVVDDDVRNIFALGSVLERHGVQVVPAQTGREAVDILQGTDDISAVLMDIMMPELDGYETIRLIRQQPSRQELPIIALTARAMQGDREKCLEAGATDYLAKPVDPEQLLGTLRTCLNR